LAFQVFAQPGGRPLSEAVEEARLLPTLYLGVATLFAVGLASLGIGHDSPRGGGGSWAVLLSGLEFLLLAALYSRASRAIDWQAIRERRVGRGVRAVSRYVDELALHRIATALLERECATLNVRVQLFLLDPPAPGSVVVRAGQ